jgi:hypothetical protein
MTPDDIIDDLAEALRDVIQDTPDSELEKDPKEAYAGLACRLIVRLSGSVTLMPKLEAEKSAFMTLPAIAAAVQELLDLRPPTAFGAILGGAFGEERFTNALKRLEELTNGVQRKVQ